MNEKLVYWVSVVLSITAAALLVGDIFMVDANHKLQREVTQRQATLNNATNMAQFHQNFVHALMDLANKNNDADIRALLATQGISATPAPDGPETPVPPIPVPGSMSPAAPAAKTK